MRKILKSWQFWICILLGLLFVGIFTATIICSIKFKDETTIFTIICAWIEFAGAVGIGILAFCQTQKGQKDEDARIRREDAQIKKQHDFEVFRHIIDVRTEYVEGLKQNLNRYYEDFNFEYVTDRFAKIRTLSKQSSSDSVALMSEVYQFEVQLRNKSIDLIQKIKNDWNKGKANDELIESIDNFYKTFTGIIDESKTGIANLESLIVKLNHSMPDLEMKLVKNINNLIAELDADLNYVLLEKSGDLNYIKKHYSYLKERDNG